MAEKKSVERRNGREDHPSLADRVGGAVNNLNNLLAVMRGHAQLAYQDATEKNVHDLIQAVFTGTARAQQEMRNMVAVLGEAAGEAGGAVSRRQARILVVDDERLVRSLMNEILTKNGHLVSVAGTEQEALEACRRDTFDVVFLDIRLDGGDGVKLLSRIRELEPDSHVVFLSGDPNIEKIWHDVRSQGADGFVRKPFDINEIEHLVDRVLTYPRPSPGA